MMRVSKLTNRYLQAYLQAISIICFEIFFFHFRPLHWTHGLLEFFELMNLPFHCENKKESFIKKMNTNQNFYINQVVVTNRIVVSSEILLK